jgi:hypothetical protein
MSEVSRASTDIDLTDKRWLGWLVTNWVRTCELWSVPQNFY